MRILVSKISVFNRALTLMLASMLAASSGQQQLPNALSAQKATTQKAQAAETGWPRTMTSGTDTFLIYQPQVEKWDGIGMGSTRQRR